MPLDCGPIPHLRLLKGGKQRKLRRDRDVLRSLPADCLWRSAFQPHQTATSSRCRMMRTNSRAEIGSASGDFPATGGIVLRCMCVFPPVPSGKPKLFVRGDVGCGLEAGEVLLCAVTS